VDHTFKSTRYNTPIQQSDKKSVRVTHPHHPLYGRTGRIVRIRRGHNARLTIELADGTQARVDSNDTDFASSSIDSAETSTTKSLLCIDGLLNIVKLIKGGR
jgi:hypothetical protein